MRKGEAVVLCRFQIVLTFIFRAITRELPDYYPFIVSKDYILTIISKWQIPARNLFDAIQRMLINSVKELVTKHFRKFSHNGLQHHVRFVDC